MTAYQERTVRIGGMSYVDQNGVWQFGQLGAKVKVHPDNVERFDRLNGEPTSHVPVPEPTVPEPAQPEPDDEPVKRRGPGRPRKDVTGG
jgi:hypothetical protein